jgi:hypothetical protein
MRDETQCCTSKLISDGRFGYNREWSATDQDLLPDEGCVIHKSY